MQIPIYKSHCVITYRKIRKINNENTYCLINYLHELDRGDLEETTAIATFARFHDILLNALYMCMLKKKIQMIPSKKYSTVYTSKDSQILKKQMEAAATIAL